MRAIVLGVFMSLALAVPALGQLVVGARLGDTVRVWATQPPLRKTVGTFIGTHGDTLSIERRYERRVDRPGYFVMRPTVDTVRVAWSALERLDVREGISHGIGTLKGLVWGLCIGAVAGAAWANASDEELAILAIPALATLGVVVGTAFGAAAGSERWRRVYDRN